MEQIHCKKLTWGGTRLTLETGRVARQADGAVMVTHGATVVLATVVGAKEAPTGQGFFPLTVHYQERSYAAGRIPGGFFKREGRPSEKESLVSRLIDRPLRPLFPATFKNEVQVLCSVLDYDNVHHPDIAAMIGASAAVSLSGMPFLGPIGSARIGYHKGSYVLNPTQQDLETSQLDLVVAGTKEGVLMVESQAQELSRDIMLGAVTFGHEAYQPVIQTINDLVSEQGARSWKTPSEPSYQELQDTVQKNHADNLLHAYLNDHKKERTEKVAAVRQDIIDNNMDEDNGIDQTVMQQVVKDLSKKTIRNYMLSKNKRVDGRDMNTVRPLHIEVGYLPRTHGSALFTRGHTQALVIATLGTGQDEQIIDALEGEYRERFLLHYNFPPYCVGETGRMMGPGRREMGHGKLAWRALSPVMPPQESCPHTVRIVSEITESDGSSSMATVCGASLALMDAGVAIHRPVAGIAMGLIKENDKVIVLSDICADEDSLGDMDFKVAGTKEGITALQMDIKVTSMTCDIMAQALQQACEGLQHILDAMNAVIKKPRDTVSEHAPKMFTIKIPVDKIRDVIGSGGKVVRDICQQSGATVDVADDGQVTISSASQESINAARSRIEGITQDPKINQIYQGRVVKVMEFGAFVNFLGQKDGLVHISELENKRVQNVSDVVKEGDKVYVQLIGFDNRGKVKLSMKRVNQKSGSLL